MRRLTLEQVTLCAIDARSPGLALMALQRSMAGVDFGRVMLLTHGWRPAVPAPGIEIVDIGPITSGAAYSQFVLRRLPGHVTTPHVLVSQWDGFVVSPQAWSAEFLQWDYIGAVWDDQPAARSVGNGGFSLRSQRLLQAGMDARITPEHPEDAALCRDHRELLEQQHGVRFAPPAVARRFAHENEAPKQPTFGFHGPKNLPAYLDAAALGACLDQLPDDFFRGRDARRLARALLRAGMPGVVEQLVRRRRAAGRDDVHTRCIGALATVARWFGAHRRSAP